MNEIPSKVLMATAWGVSNMIEMLEMNIDWYSKGHPKAPTADEITKKAVDIIEILRFLEAHMYPPKIQWEQLRKVKDLKSFVPKKYHFEITNSFKW
jgi:hypothetical protein